MWIYSIKTNTCDKATVLHFGSGLIGHAIWECLGKVDNRILQNEKTPYYWGAEDEKIEESWTGIFGKVKGLNTKELHVIWAAGKAGFSADEETTQKELLHFKKAISLIQKAVSNQSIEAHFYFMGSAGGMHEGVKMVQSNDQISLQRPYGRLKNAQEGVLKAATEFKSITLFRISSVYSHNNIKGRLGLIAVLVKNGIANAVSNIFGAESTLRDYVLDDDIAKCQYQQMMQKNKKGVEITYLIDGKPSSLTEIRHMVERVLGKKLYLKYSLEKNNATDITFSSHLRSPLFRSSTLYTNIKMLHQNLLKGN